MNVVPKLSRVLLSSPWFLLVFLVVPVAVISSRTLHLGLPFASPGLLLANNIVFACLAACRFLWYLSRAGKEIRYGASGRPGNGFETMLAAKEARGLLARAGFRFAVAGDYGEKRDLGYHGTTALYGGLFLLLAVGSLDNLRQFSGVLLDGMGPATKLSAVTSYRSISKGPLSGGIHALPSMRITKQVFPDSTYPKGATEITLLSQDGQSVTTVLKPGTGYRYGAYDITMTKLVFEPQIVIKTKDSRTLFDAVVKLDPLVQKRGPFGFYGFFVGAQVGGGVYYQPEKSRLKLVVSRNDKRVVADMTFQVDQQVTVGEYLLSCAKMGQWSEIRVVRRRHKELLWLGGLLALVGLALRVGIRPQRVWLEEREGGCRVSAVGNEARRILQS